MAGEIIKALTPFRTDVDLMRGLFLALRHELALGLDLAPPGARWLRKEQYIGELGQLIGFTYSHSDCQ